MKISHLIFPVAALCMFCNESFINNTPDSGPSIIPQISIVSNSRIYWYSDSLLEELIYPSINNCTPGTPCAIVSTGPWDYTCTLLPDTIWGIIDHDFFSSETLFCHSDSCWAINDTVVYSISNYKSWQANALCSKSAKAYTRYGLCYETSPAEDTVRIWNTHFDTTFKADIFCLSKLPLDSSDGVWFLSIDTFFCPAALINTYDDHLTRQDIINYTSNLKGGASCLNGNLH